MDDFSSLTIAQISPKDAHDLILNKHYAHRLPQIRFAFGLFSNGNIAGAVTYGSPPSAPQRSGLLGPSLGHLVIELNRLVLLDNFSNGASFLVSHSLRLLRKHGPWAVLSYADTEQGHLGIVYQASNFLYCGLSEKRTNWAIRGMEHKHGQTIADETRGMANRAAYMRKKYGDDFYLAPRPRKHRYVFFLGSHKQRKKMRESLRYTVKPYPKETTNGQTQ